MADSEVLARPIDGKLFAERLQTHSIWGPCMVPICLALELQKRYSFVRIFLVFCSDQVDGLTRCYSAGASIYKLAKGKLGIAM